MARQRYGVTRTQEFVSVCSTAFDFGGSISYDRLAFDKLQSNCENCGAPAISVEPRCEYCGTYRG